MLYSIIVPVYNRPDHIEGLLACLEKQTYKNFETIVVESGSSIRSDEVVAKFKKRINVHYCPTGNHGQGFSRNYGMTHAKGDYFLILDSDILLDNFFIEHIDKGIKAQKLDAHGGPDKLHPHSNTVQKAVNYMMTSFLTTGGTRGKKKSIGKYYPRSFNMGFSRKVYEETQGFNLPYMGEDLELSRRIYAKGFNVGLIEEAHVFHERKKSLKTFYKQIHWFGRSRINTFRMFPDTLKLAHFIPLGFILYLLVLLFSTIFFTEFTPWFTLPLLIYLFAIQLDAVRQYKNPIVALLSMTAVFYLFFGYAFGMITEYFKPSNINKTEKIS